MLTHSIGFFKWPLLAEAVFFFFMLLFHVRMCFLSEVLDQGVDKDCGAAEVMNFGYTTDSPFDEFLLRSCLSRHSAHRGFA